jgi:hypothetical protein
MLEAGIIDAAIVNFIADPVARTVTIFTPPEVNAGESTRGIEL